MDGTTWKRVYTDPTDGDAMTDVYTFNSPNFSFTITWTGSAGSGTQTGGGTYSISGNKVTLTPTVTSGGTTLSGTISGNKLTIEGDEFTKQ